MAVLFLTTSGFAAERGVPGGHPVPYGHPGGLAPAHDRTIPPMGDRDVPPRWDGPREGKCAVPYGDFCPRCSVYGVGGHGQIERKEAVDAMRAYFEKRGLVIRGVRGEGRFIKVDVYRHGELADRIIFDRKTGRIRSMY